MKKICFKKRQPLYFVLLKEIALKSTGKVCIAIDIKEPG